MESKTSTAWVIAVFGALAALGVVVWNDDRSDDQARDSDRQREIGNVQAQADYNRYLIELFEHQDCVQDNRDRARFMALYDTFDRYADGSEEQATIDDLRATVGPVRDCPVRPAQPRVELDGHEE